MKISVYRVDFLLETHMWNEGFSKAAEPWLRLYTDDLEVVSQFPAGSEIVGPAVEGGSTQNYLVKVDHCIVDDKVVDEEVYQFRRDNGLVRPEDLADVAGDPLQDANLRYFWMVGEPTQRTLEAVTRRLNSWPGL